MPFVREFRERVREYACIESGECLLVGFSGGGDSVTLVSLLSCIQDEYPHQIALAHVAPFIDNDVFDQSECTKKLEWVQDFACRSGLPLHQVSHPLCASNYEAQARRHRYAFFQKVMREYRYTKLFLAHHSDDQVETFFLHLMRSARVKTMRLYEYFAGMCVVRPLLSFTRAAILKYLRENGVAYYNDLSNLNTRYRRNALRIDVLPALEKVFPLYRESVLRCAERVECLERLFGESLERALEALTVRRDAFEWVVDICAFVEYGYSVQIALLRGLFDVLLAGDPRLRWKYQHSSFSEMLRKLHSHKQQGNHILLQHKYFTVYLEYTELVFELQRDLAYDSPVISLSCNMVYLLFRWQGLYYKVAVRCSVRLEERARGESFCDFDMALLVWPLLLRTVCRGDVLPLDHSRNIRVTSLLMNTKIPKRLRHLTRILVDRTQILAVFHPTRGLLWRSHAHRPHSHKPALMLSIFHETR